MPAYCVGETRAGASPRRSAKSSKNAGPTWRRKQSAKAPAPRTRVRKPLLAVDGDSFAHRAYHGLPKTIRRAGDRGGGAIVGFANFLLRLYEQEKPRAVVVAWDTLEEPTYRHDAFDGYQAGREFDEELLDPTRSRLQRGTIVRVRSCSSKQPADLPTQKTQARRMPGLRR